MEVDMIEDIPEEGMRVHVYSTDKKKDLGLGIIEKVDSSRIEEPGLTITAIYPSRIVLDSGEVINGPNCWWTIIHTV
jgi:hypothetical protein